MSDGITYKIMKILDNNTNFVQGYQYEATFTNLPHHDKFWQLTSHHLPVLSFASTYWPDSLHLCPTTTTTTTTTYALQDDN